MYIEGASDRNLVIPKRKETDCKAKVAMIGKSLWTGAVTHRKGDPNTDTSDDQVEGNVEKAKQNPPS